MPSSTVLVASEAFDAKLDAACAARAIGLGLGAGSAELSADPCPIETLPGSFSGAFDARMRSALAVVIAGPDLDHETLLRGGGVFEVATRARQAGVPTYAIVGRDGLDLFEKRILDLQVVLEAGTRKTLEKVAKDLVAFILSR